MARTSTLILAMVACAAPLIGCGESETKDNPDDPQYQAGYEAGKDDGVNEVCSDAKAKKESIYDFLVEAKVCPSGL
jgi:hypothetical protein